MFQDGPHFGHGLKAFPWIGGQASLNDAGKRGAYLPGSERVALMRRADARQQFVEDDAEAEDIGGNVECLARRLFWRHVAWRTENGASDGVCHRVREIVRVVAARPQQFGQAEIYELDRPIACDQDVGGLQVAVQDPSIVSGLQCARDLDRLADRFGLRDRTAQRHAVDVLEHEIARPDVVQLTDVRMVQGRDGPRFVFESTQAIRVIGDRRREHLDGDCAIEPRVAGFVDLTHPAGAKERDDFVRAEPRAGSQGQFAGIIKAAGKA